MAGLKACKAVTGRPATSKGRIPMPDIYDQHKAAFANVSAFVVTDKLGERIATVAIKFPRDGAGRLYAYVHMFGVEMVRAHANGYGYDKTSAAVADAITRIPAYTALQRAELDGYGAAIMANRQAFLGAVQGMDSQGWLRQLESAGFRVFQAV